MGTAPHTVRSYRFGAFAVDLRTAGHRPPLRDQPLQLLLALLERPGELVTREELTKRLWPAGTFVDFDRGLNKAMNHLREALGDSADHPQFIETLPRRGYRFIAPVTHDVYADADADADAGAVPAIGAAPIRSRRPPWLALGTASIVAIAVVIVVIVKSDGRGIRRWIGSPPHIASLAVIPLENLSGDAAQDYFADG